MEKLQKTTRLHPMPVRFMHWINAFAMLIMITSGWGIYDDYVIINGLHFSHSLRLGDNAADSLLWHFAGMWFIAINGVAYLLYGVFTGRFRERLLPIKFTELVKTVRETLHFKIAHDDITRYNAVQKLLYIVVILAGISQVLTGLAIWKPIQFSGLVSLLGGVPDCPAVPFQRDGDHRRVSRRPRCPLAAGSQHALGHADRRPPRRETRPDE